MAEETEGIIRDTVEDTSNISKATGLKPKRICYYVASPWKWEIYLQALRAAEAGTLNAGQLIRESMEDPQLKGKATEVAKYTQKVAEDVSRVPSDVRKTRIQLGVIRELEALKDALDFYRREFNADIQVYSEEDLGRYDPNARSHLAQPHRPAIYVE